LGVNQRRRGAGCGLTVRLPLQAWLLFFALGTRRAGPRLTATGGALALQHFAGRIDPCGEMLPDGINLIVV